MHDSWEAWKISLNREMVKWRRNIDLRVIAALAHVNVIIRMYWFFRTEFTAQKFDRAIGNDLEMR